MGGIIFFKTKNLEQIKSFYIDQIGCNLWLDQDDCLIFEHSNMLIGFCRRDRVDRCGTITFFYDDKNTVDEMYKKFKSIAAAPPKEIEKYRIYNFFAVDPEGRQIEFQYFKQEIKPV